MTYVAIQLHFSYLQITIIINRIKLFITSNTSLIIMFALLSTIILSWTSEAGKKKKNSHKKRYNLVILIWSEKLSRTLTSENMTTKMWNMSMKVKANSYNSWTKCTKVIMNNIFWARHTVEMNILRSHKSNLDNLLLSFRVYYSICLNI